MSEKTDCPGCNSYTSSITFALNAGDPCPYCGLSAATILEVLSVRARRGDEKLKQRAEEALIENGRLKEQIGRFEKFRWNIKQALVEQESATNGKERK